MPRKSKSGDVRLVVVIPFMVCREIKAEAAFQGVTVGDIVVAAWKAANVKFTDRSKPKP